MDIITTILIIILCLLLEGFFSGSEIGVISADQIKLPHRAAKGSKGAKLALKMLEKPEWLLSVTLVGTNISVVTNTTMVTALMIHLFGENGSWMAVAVAAPLIWIFGEIVPKSIFQQKSDVLTPYIIFILRFFSYLFYPILMVFSYMTYLLAKLAGGNEKNPFTLREEIVTMLQMSASSKDGDIHDVEQNMIRRMFNFTETTVNDVMLPLIEVNAVGKNISCAEAKRFSTECSHVRLPVYDERIDRIIGVLNVLELLGIDPQQPINDFVRPAYYVTKGKSIKDLMVEMQKEKTVIAIVVDEYGGAQGIVTIEDIMEEVVEDIEDEYDSYKENGQWIRRQGDNDYIVNARIPLVELCDKLQIELPAGKYITLAGMIINKTHSVPEKGAIIKVNGISLVVHRSTARAVLEVRIHW